MSTKDPVVYGKYQLIEQLARGGMAEVFKAKAHGVEGFEKILVIKRILPELSENRAFVEMFINEAKIAVTLSHANIVQVFDLGWAENSYFIAMEYVAGMDLSALFRATSKDPKKRRFPPEIAIYIVSELAKGLDYAHRRRDNENRPLNIIHRDVSPQNVLISYEGEVKLTDFGIAKARSLAQAVTELGIVKGKYAYMAPEQLQGGRLDARTDVFAVGTLLFKALSGVNPFLGRSVYETLQKIRSGNIPKVRQFVPEVPSEIDKLLSRTLAHEPDKRFPDAGTLYEELVQFLFSTGKRVGCRELSDYIDNLLPPDKNVGTERRHPTGSVTAESEDATILERKRPDLDIAEETRVLRGGRQPKRDPSGEQESDSLSERMDSLRLKSEWRDGIFISIVYDEEEEFDESLLVRFIEKFNGDIIDTSCPNKTEKKKCLLVVFGERIRDRRDIDNAANCSLSLSRYALVKAAESNKTTSLRIAITMGRILIDISGELIRDKTFFYRTNSAFNLALKCEPGSILLNKEASKSLRSRYQLLPSEEAGNGNFILSSKRSTDDTQGIFIGRRDELLRIGEILSQVNRGTPSIIGLFGEGGIGKSRFLSETLRRLILAGYKTSLHKATLVPQLKSIPLSAIQVMLSRAFGKSKMPPGALIHDHKSHISDLGLLAQDQAEIIELMGDTLREDKKTPIRKELINAITHTIEKLANDRLTLLAWENAEYMDDESNSILEHILENIKDKKLCIFQLYSPGYPLIWSGKEGFIEIELEPLTDPDVARLIASRLGYEEIPIELLRDIKYKCGGNPLYVEEYLLSLLESDAVLFIEDQVLYEHGNAKSEVPVFLRYIISTWIGRLPPLSRYVLQIASLAGEQFNAGIVAAAADTDFSSVSKALSAPEMKRMLRQLRPSDYQFTTDLIAAVIRDGLTQQTQKDIHSSIAKAIETLHPERCNDMANQLAYHYQEAGEWKKSVNYHIRSANILEAEYTFDKAIENLQVAIALLSENISSYSEDILNLYERVGSLSYRCYDLSNGFEKVKKAIKIAEEVKADKYLVRFSLLLGRLLIADSRYKEGRYWIEQAQHVARGVADPNLSWDVLLATASADSHVGNYEKAVGELQEALQLASSSDNTKLEISCLISLALTYSRMQDHNSALDTLSKTITKVKDISDPKMSCKVYRLESQINHFAGNDHAAIRAASMALEVAKDAGLTYECIVNAYNIGNSYMHIDDYGRAFASLRYSYEMAIEHGFVKLQMSNMRLLGFIDALRFSSQQGRSQLVQAIQYAESQGDVWDIVQGKILLAIVDERSGELENAHKLLKEIREITLKHGNRQYIEEAERAMQSLDSKKPIELPL